LVQFVTFIQYKSENFSESTSKSEDQMKGALLLDIVVTQGSAIFQLLSCKDESLLVWRDSFLVLDLCLYVLDGVVGLDVQGDSLSSEGLHEDLHHTSSQSEDQVESALLLDIVIAEGSSIFKLFSSEDESLLVWGNSFLVLDLCLDVLNGVRLFDIEGDSLTSEGLDEDLHTSSQSENQVKSGFLLNITVLKSSSVLKLLSSEDESLLVWGNSFLILNLSLDVLNGIGLFDIEGNSLTSESLDEDLHSTSKSQDEMESAFFLNVVVLEGATVFKLLACEDESLLVWRDTFFVLDLGLDVFDGVALLNI